MCHYFYVSSFPPDPGFAVFSCGKISVGLEEEPGRGGDSHTCQFIESLLPKGARCHSGPLREVFSLSSCGCFFPSVLTETFCDDL